MIQRAAVLILSVALGGSAQPDPGAKTLEYLSDFFCFAGGDESGRVVFAFDANRGRSDDEFQAEFFSVLWVEGDGWQKLKGTGDLKGDAISFRDLPSSRDFRLSGTALEGLTINSASNDLALTVQPLELHSEAEVDGAEFDTGSAAATLALGDRTIPGRVTYEFCFLPDKNPLAKTYTDLFGDGYHGVYAFVGEAADADDLRFHRSGGTLEPLVERFAGFLTESERVDAVPGEAEFKISNRSLGGFFRWPGRYRASWETPAEEGHPGRELALDVRLRDRETLINYVFGGVAVAIVNGVVERDGVEEPAFGLALIVR